MSALPSQPQNRSSSPSQAGFLGRYRAATAADHSPWRRYPTCYGGVSGGTRWSSSSTSPFERSGSAITVSCREVVPADGDHLTAGRDDHDHDNWMCDDGSFGDEVGRAMNLEEVRNSSWLRGFLARMGEEANDPVAAKLCPACKGDRGGSLTYPGLRALLDHARGAGPKRVWLHRWFAQILEEELRNRCVAATAADNDNWMCDDGSFSDEVGQALKLEEARNSSWFRGFLAGMGELSPEEVKDPVAQKLCPACKGDRGGFPSYGGFPALLVHAKGATKKRVWLHRWFAQMLEEVLNPNEESNNQRIEINRNEYCEVLLK